MNYFDAMALDGKERENAFDIRYSDAICEDCKYEEQCDYSSPRIVKCKCFDSDFAWRKEK